MRGVKRSFFFEKCKGATTYFSTKKGAKFFLEKNKGKGDEDFF